MHELISSFLSNESRFGRLMTRWGIVIAANLMFILFSLPVVTTGAALAGLYTVMLKTLRGDGVINPFVWFWRGFKGNFKQATIAWIIALALVAFGYFDVRICLQAGGVIGDFRYAIFALGVVLLVGVIYLYPTMAAFENTLPFLFRTGYYFALKKPLKLLVILFFQVFPLFLTYTDVHWRPLYAFLWFMFGFGAIAMLTARLLLPEFKPFLPIVDDYGDFILDENGNQQKPGQDPETETETSSAPEKTEAEILEEMKKLDM